MKGLESVREHIKREFDKARNVRSSGSKRRAQPISLDARAANITRNVPRTVLHVNKHEGPWHIVPPQIRGQKDLDVLFDEALKSLGYGK